MRGLILLSVFMLTGCTIGKGYIFETDSKTRMVKFDKGGSGTITTPYGSLTINGPGSYYVLSDGAMLPVDPPPEEKP